MILGLDISTSCTGWSVLSSVGSLIDIGYIRLGKIETMYQKAETVKKVLEEIKEKHNIASVYIEQNLQAFRAGFSSAKTIDKLARFNGIISYIAHDVFDIDPDFLNVNRARKSLGITIVRKKDGGLPTKEQVFHWVSNEITENNFLWPKKILKSGPRKGSEILMVECYDMADAYVIARAGYVCEQKNNKVLRS